MATRQVFESIILDADSGGDGTELTEADLVGLLEALDGVGESTGTKSDTFEIGSESDPDDTDITLLFGDALHYLAWSNPDSGDGRFELSHALSAPAFVGDGSGLTSLPDQHQQNTDTGTTATFFVINSGRSGHTAGLQFLTTHDESDQNWEIYANADFGFVAFEKDGDPAVLSADGSELTNLNASALTSGTVPDARLSSNVPLWGAGNTKLSIAAPTTGTNRRTLYLAAPTGGSTNHSLIADGAGQFGDVLTVSKTLTETTNLIVARGTGTSFRGQVAADGPGGSGYSYQLAGVEKWVTIISTGTGSGEDLLFFSQSGTPGIVMRLKGGTAKGATINASGTGGEIDLQYGGTSRIKVNSTGIGFFGVTPVVQQSMEDLASAPTESDFNELLGILRAYGLLATSE